MAPDPRCPLPPRGGADRGRGVPHDPMRPVNRWRRALAVYADPKIFLITVMGFSSGLPLLLTLSTLSYWLAKLGVSKTSIGLFAAVGVPYSFKFLWAPLLDQIRPPFLGRRRGWAIVIQVALALAILAMGFTDPAVNPWWTALAAVVVAFLSASQDIVIDAYRIEILPEEEQGAGSAATQVGYRFGLLAAGAGALALADFVAWPVVFAILAGLMGIGVIAFLVAPEPPAPPLPKRESFTDWFMRGVVGPLAEFFLRRGAIVILLFVLLYKFGDAISGTMATPFYVELGFTGRRDRRRDQGLRHRGLAGRHARRRRSGGALRHHARAPHRRRSAGGGDPALRALGLEGP